ncbi:MAG: hypothetical protein Q4B68_07865 [Bacteroidales bacterium]|nr:hypothetical protein [Bacteroidales bacterium]
MKRITILLSTIFALLAMPCSAKDKQLVMVFTSPTGEQQTVPVENIKNISFVNDVVENFAEGHAIVDLGLSVCWAYNNLDLDGENLEAEPYTLTKALYGWADATGKKRSVDAADYPSKEETGTVLPPDEISGTQFDIARKNWGGEWRLPTNDEMVELVQSCTWIFETVNQTPGFRIIGPNGNSIFLPACGWRYGDQYGAEGVYGGYWSGTLSQEEITAGRCVAFNTNTHNTGYTKRYYGLAVRPVIKLNR